MGSLEKGGGLRGEQNGDRQTDRQTDRQVGRQADRNTDRQTDKDRENTEDRSFSLFSVMIFFFFFNQGRQQILNHFYPCPRNLSVSST